ncbi:MAG TPA: protein kinase [Kofleriaceae bacterium]|nr:protein kinase [Kofleriaceae bacterium]
MRQPVPFGKYLLLDRISVGGMAEVFKAKSYGVEGFEKVIAIKRILPSMGEDKDFIKMFIDEAKIAGQLSHANICQIFELGKFEGGHFIAMEYIWGKDLLQIQNRLRKIGQPMPVPMACHIIAKACEGLDYAHRKRDPMGRHLEIVHRDCSPQNILVSYEGEVKVIDFGIAKAASRSARTNAGVLKGKFGYMSPEQVRGLPLDARSDLFALGTVFYESLTGDRLFQGESDFSTLERVRNVDVRPVSQVNDAVPPEVERIVMKALARDPSSRYQTGAEMHAEITAFLTQLKVPFTGKALADWLKSAFKEDLARERATMEEYKKIGRDGLIAGVPQARARADVVAQLGAAGAPEGDKTELGAPDLEEMLAASDGARTPPPRGKSHQGDFDDEGPTEIFGEISTPEPRRAPLMATPTPQPQAAPHHASVPVVATPTGMGAQPDGTSAGGLPSFYPVLQPGRIPTGPEGPYPPALPGSVSEVAPAPMAGRRRRGRPAVGRDVAIGCAIAALVLAGFISAKFLLFGDEPRASAEAAAQGTIMVTVEGAQPAEVSIDGVLAGAVSGDAPLTLASIAPGDRVVRVTRTGVAPCEQKVAVAGDKIEVVRCSFTAPAASGRLVLSGVTEVQRVFVDEMEITSEAAREPIPLSAGSPHSVVVKAGDKVVDTFSVELDADEEERHEVKAAAVAARSETKTPRGSDPAPRPPDPVPVQTKVVEKPEPTTKPKPEPTTKPRTEPTTKPKTEPTTKPKTEPKAASTAPGSFTAFTKPWARVFIDGKDTGKMTPIIPRSAISLSPGSHKVTFQVGDQKFHFTVQIESGKTKNLVKVLPVK